MKKPLVVNLFGAPGAGKSTGAAIVFAELKKAGINAELVTEFAKDKTWEHNIMALGCQEYVFGKQSYRLRRCRDDVEVIVTDSPLPLSIIYNNNPALDHNFTNVVMNVLIHMITIIITLIELSPIILKAEIRLKKKVMPYRLLLLAYFLETIFLTRK